MSDRQLFASAARRLGLITREEALSTVSARRLRTLIEHGAIVRVRPGVLRVVGAPESWRQHLLAVCLAAGPGACASFRAAAALWALPGSAQDALEITTPIGRRVRLRGVTVHVTSVTGPRHTTSVGGIPVTTPARTLCDLTAVASPTSIERAIEDALRRRLTTESAMASVFADLATPGRRRSTVMRELLAERIPGIERTESEPDARLVRIIRRAGLPEPVLQHRLRLESRAIRLDLAYPEQRVAIEYDGWDVHRQRSVFERDRARDNELTLRGWTVLRFTAKTSCLVRKAIE